MQRFKRIVFLIFFTFFVFASFSFAQDIKRVISPEKAIEIIDGLPEVEILRNRAVEGYKFKLEDEVMYLVKVSPASLENTKEQFAPMCFEIDALTGKVTKNLEEIIGKDVQRIQKIGPHGEGADDVYGLLDEIERKWAIIGGPAVPYLVDFLRNGNYWVSRTVNNALGKIGEPAVPYLVEALEDSKDTDFEATIVGLLGHFSNDPVVISILSEALKDENPNVRLEAIDSLTSSQHPSAISLLKGIVGDKDEDESIRIKVISALACREWYKKYRQDSSYTSLFIGILDDESESASIRAEAVFALGETNNPSVIPVLIKALKDKSSRVRENAALGLHYLLPGELVKAETKSSSVPVLVEALKDKNPEVRENAVFILGKIGDASVVPTLIKMLKDRNPGVISSACSALANIGDASAIPHLEKLLHYRGGIPGIIEAIIMKTLFGGQFPSNASLVRKSVKQAIEEIKRKNKIEDDQI